MRDAQPKNTRPISSISIIIIIIMSLYQKSRTKLCICYHLNQKDCDIVLVSLPWRWLSYTILYDIYIRFLLETVRFPFPSVQSLIVEISSVVVAA